MSKHRHHDKCCIQPMYGMGGCGMPGYGGGTTGCGGLNTKWVYALLVLIVIVLQFGRRKDAIARVSPCCCADGEIAADGVAGAGGFFNNQLIDNSVLFIIVVFLLILCSGCLTGGSGNYGTGGFGGGFGL